jgi:hypothetical protein
MHMIGHRVEKFGHSKLCVYYDQFEDKLHAFVQCNHIWSWFKDLVYALYSSYYFQHLDLFVLLFGH